METKSKVLRWIEHVVSAGNKIMHSEIRWGRRFGKGHLEDRYLDGITKLAHMGPRETVCGVYSGRSLKLTTHLYLVPRLRM
jgi:hypothetical protein